MTFSSMTGFARKAGHRRDLSWTWEVKSVNGRTLDIRCRLPAGLDSLEPQIRALAQANFRRGSLYVTLEIRRAVGAETIMVNEAALAQIVAIARHLRRKHRLAAPSPEGLLALRGVLELASAEEDGEAIATRDEALLSDLHGVFASLAQMRRAEGEKLRMIVLTHIDRIEELTRAAKESTARSPELARNRLAEQVHRLVETGARLDRDRLHQEAVLLASRSDINEELDRIFAHLGAVRDLFASPEPVGRKFDFLAQELNREANTLCSKAVDYAITEAGLEMKIVIDQMREQVQNLE